MRLNIGRLVDVILLEPIRFSGEESEDLRLRIEVYQWAGSRFTCQVWRQESYRVMPSFQNRNGNDVFDHEVEVLEDGFDWTEIVGSTSDEVVQLTLTALADRIDEKLELEG